jgi:hypothetical protein
VRVRARWDSRAALLWILVAVAAIGLAWCSVAERQAREEAEERARPVEIEVVVE